MNIKLIAKKYDLKKIDKELGDNFWSPVDVCHVNDWVLRAVAIKGEFHWHKHDDDELFLIYKGEIIIKTESGDISLKEGESTAISAGMKHKPMAEKRAIVLLLEPETLNTKGD